MKSWLKGGIIGGGIGLFGLLLFILLPGNLKVVGAIILSVGFFVSINLIKLFAINIDLPNLEDGYAQLSMIFFYSLVLSILIYFLIGAIIGFIVGKIKNKRNTKHVK